MDTAGSLLRRARTLSGLSQTELARRAGTTQSVVSLVESGRRQPSVATLTSLVEATGHDLDVQLAAVPQHLAGLTGPVGRRLRRARVEVLSTAGRHGIRVLGVFGSVARAQDRATSDVDLLVDLPEGIGLLGIGRAQQDLEDLLGVPVDLVPATSLKPGVRTAVEADLVAL